MKAEDYNISKVGDSNGSKNIEDNDSIVELPQEVNEIDSTQSVPEEIEQIDDFPELETANEPSSVSNFANRGINKLDENYQIVK